MNQEQLFKNYDTLSISKYLEPVAMQDKWSPHPFCIGNEHIKKFHIDTTKPCVMRVNKETGAWSNKRETKLGIIDTCGLSEENHTVTRKILFKIIQTFDAQLLEDSLQEETGELKKFFDMYNIVGFSFMEPKEYHILGITKPK